MAVQPFARLLWKLIANVIVIGFKVAEAADVIAGYINARNCTDSLLLAGNQKQSSHCRHSSMPSAP